MVSVHSRKLAFSNPSMTISITSAKADREVGGRGRGERRTFFENSRALFQNSLCKLSERTL
jgi:hypothetical protein